MLSHDCCLAVEIGGGAVVAAAPIALEAPKPAVPPKKSITPGYIICLEDGKQFKSLKRHLRSQYNLSPDAYREKWGLPPDYPMVAPAYAEQRSAMAKRIGLGKGVRGGLGGVAGSNRDRDRCRRPCRDLLGR